MQGEGDRLSARRYNRDVREFIAEGKVDSAAHDAEAYVERDPEDAARAEKTAQRGPHATRVSVEELIAKGRTIVDRVRPYIQRASQKLKSRFSSQRK